MTTKSIYIVLTSTGTVLSGAIKTYTGHKYNHASISLTEDLSEMYSFGRKNPTNPLHAGFIKEDLVVGTYSWFPFTECLVLKMDITRKEYRKIKKIIMLFKKKEKRYRYNFIGLFAVVLNTAWERNAAYFCSQFVAEVLRKSGITLFDKSSSLVKPNDFLEAPRTEVVYEGMLYNYPPVANYLPDDFMKRRHFSFLRYFNQQMRAGLLRHPQDESPISFKNDYFKQKKIYIDNKLHARKYDDFVKQKDDE